MPLANLSNPLGGGASPSTGIIAGGVLYGLNGQTITGNSSGAWVITGPTTITHSTTNSLFLGTSAGGSNTGIWTTGVGTETAQTNTGDKVTAVGYRSAMENTGHYANGFGDGTIQYNTGSYSNAFGNDALMASVGGYSNAFGWNAGRYNRGTAANLFGYEAGKYNIQSYSSGFGSSALRYNEGAYNTAVGDAAFSTFTQNGAGAKAFDYNAITVVSGASTIAITAHGFGSNGDYVNLLYTQGTGPIGGLTDGAVYTWYVVDANTIRTPSIGQNITSAGTGTGHTLTPQTVYSNATAIGANAQPTKSNQVTLGDSNVTEVLTAGTFKGGGLNISSTSALGGTVTLSTGNINLANAFFLQGRNAANSSYVPIVKVNSSDALEFGSGGFGALFSGSVTLNAAFIGSIQSLAGAGPINVTTITTALTTTGANALTLADGTAGQIKRIVMVADGGDGTLTPTTKTGFTTITFNDVGDAVTLQFFTTLGWMIVSNYGCTVA